MAAVRATKLSGQLRKVQREESHRFATQRLGDKEGQAVGAPSMGQAPTQRA